MHRTTTLAGVHFFNIPLAEGIAFSVPPALSLSFAGEPTSGVEYCLSSLDFTGTLDNRIALWAMLNTSSLDSAHPNVKLVNRILTSEVYGFPPAATQPAGPTPLGTLLKEPLEQVDTGDDRMQQVVFENGKLWSGLTTVIGGGSGPHASALRAGIAYFVVNPSVVGQNVNGTITRQGYVAAPGTDSVMYPSIGVTADGQAAAMALYGVGTSPKHYPSMGFVDLSGDDDKGPRISGLAAPAWDAGATTPGPSPTPTAPSGWRRSGFPARRARNWRTGGLSSAA